MSDSMESYEEFGEDEIDENQFNFASGDDQESVSDIDVSSSEEEILTMKKKLEDKQAKHSKANPSDDEESKEPKDVSNLVKTNPDVIKARKAKEGELEVNFELVQPNEAYYHQIKTLILKYLDGPESEALEVIPLADHICERVSIG